MKQSRKKVVGILVLMLVLLSGVVPVSAADLCVNETGDDGCFTSINAALAAAAPGDEIEVEEGVYTENVVVAVPGVTLTGDDAVIVPASLDDPAILVVADGVVVEGFEIDGQFGDAGIVLAGASGATISNNEVNNSAFAIVLDAGSQGNEISDNEVDTCIMGISTWDHLSILNVIEDNHVEGCASTGFFNFAHGNVFEGNHAVDNGAGFVDILELPGDLAPKDVQGSLLDLNMSSVTAKLSQQAQQSEMNQLHADLAASKVASLPALKQLGVERAAAAREQGVLNLYIDNTAEGNFVGFYLASALDAFIGNTANENDVGFEILGGLYFFGENEASENGNQGFLVKGLLNLFVENEANDNGQFEVGADGDGFFVTQEEYAFGGSLNIFVDNDANDNYGDGFDLDVNEPANWNLLFDNSADGNGSDGIDVGGNENLIIGNDATNNNRDGFEVGGNENLLQGNEASGNGENEENEEGNVDADPAGFDINGNDNTVVENEAEENEADGFLSSDGMGNFFGGNVSNENDGFGFWDDTTGLGTAGTANGYDGNLCEDNDAGGSSPAGLCFVP